MRPEHRHANQVLQHYPDREAMADAWRQVPEELRSNVGALVRRQQAMFSASRFFAWCTVRPSTSFDFCSLRRD